MIKKGIIRAMVGSFHSGLGYLIVETESRIEELPCDNAPTVRALEAIYGRVIGHGHTIDNRCGGHIGQEIFYSMDDTGMMLGGFTPVDQAAPEILEAYEYLGQFH